MRQKLTLLVMLVCLSAGVALGQAKQVSGKVLSSEDKQPIPGVSVFVKEAPTVGTSTNLDGRFSLKNLPSSAKTLVFTFVGYQSQEVAIKGEDVSVLLVAATQKLDEVVVTALGITKNKKSLGYSVQNLKSEDIARTGENDVLNSLSSKVAGLQVTSSSGTPGASTKILIRGNSSFTGENQPLVVIDGVPIDNSTSSTVAGDYPYNMNLQGVNNSNRALDINPDDIESVSVLKGPSAAALYGARAANGAIVYTTKKGRSGAPRITYGFNTEFNKVSQLPDEQMLYVQGSIVNGTPTYQPGITPNSWGPKYTDLQGVNIYNNTKDFFKTGETYTHNLSFTGGDGKNSYRASLSRMDQKGIVPNTDLRRTTFRVNTDNKILDYLTFSGTFNYTNSNSTMAQNGSNTAGVMLPLLRAPINFDLRNYQNVDGSSNNFYPAYDNPYWSAYNNPFTSSVDRVIASGLIDLKPIDWLNVTYKVGADIYTDHRRQIFAIGSNAVQDLMGEVDQNTIRYQQYYQDFIVALNKTWFEKLTTSLNMGSNLTQTYTEQIFGRGTQLSIPNFYNLSSASTLYSSESSATTRTAALFFDGNIGWNNYLFLNFTGRNEWSSTFGRAKNHFFYPSVSASFVFTELLPKNEILNYGKLRLAHAYGGNSPSVYSTNNYYIVPSFADGFTNGNSFPYLSQNGFTLSNTLGNSNLKPEKTIETEVGLEFRMFNNRFSVEATWYNKETSDILVARPIAGSSGFQAIVSNSGKMRNRGVEILANGTPLKIGNFAWRIDVNFAKNVNKVLALAPNVNEVSIESAFTQIGSYAIVGQPYGVLYSTKWERDTKGNLIIGSNGLPIATQTSGNIGDPFPDWTAGLRNTFTYKGLSLSALLDIRHGGDGWCGTVARLNRLGRTAASVDRERTYVIPGVTQSGQPNTTPVSAYNYFVNYLGDGPLAATENSVFSTSWVRLREISLSYRISKLPSKFGWVKYIEFSAIGRNLWLHTNYPGVDPETSLTGANSNLNGFDYFNNPGTKTYSFGIKFGLF